MQQRFLYLWLTHWKTDCHRIDMPETGDDSPKPEPVVITRADHKGVLVCGSDKAAQSRGLAPGMRLAEARSIYPALRDLPEQPDLYERHLGRLIRAMDRYSPWVARDRFQQETGQDGPMDGGDAGLWLEITGGSHLFGGESALLELVLRDVKSRGYAGRAAIADTAGAAWGAARCHPAPAEQRILSLPRDHDIAAGFPISALRLPEQTRVTLFRLGLKHLGDITPMPRAHITTRLGPEVLQRLDQFYGRLPEHLNFNLPDRPWLIRRSFGEPLGDAANLAIAVESMITELCDNLAQENLGLRRIILRCVRVDGHTHTITLGTGSPCQSAPHVLRLLSEKMPGVDTGFGIEQVIVYAPWVEHVAFRQSRLDQQQEETTDQIALAQLIDRISHHLGPRDMLFHPGHHASHLPERASVRQAVNARTYPARRTDMTLPKRPVRLIDPPEPVEILARDTNGTPSRLRWRKMAVDIIHAEGPERICPEWWQCLDQDEYALSPKTRDYFRIRDQAGRLLWAFRTGTTGQDIWSIHGLFGD
ncbi:Y-family DNA polymerase [Thalassospira xiamenensis]|nr:DNA polymerase Y family protein [Thalassospira xiamenensis]